MFGDEESLENPVSALNSLEPIRTVSVIPTILVGSVMIHLSTDEPLLAPVIADVNKASTPWTCSWPVQRLGLPFPAFVGSTGGESLVAQGGRSLALPWLSGGGCPTATRSTPPAGTATTGPPAGAAGLSFPPVPRGSAPWTRCAETREARGNPHVAWQAGPPQDGTPGVIPACLQTQLELAPVPGTPGGASILQW